MGTGLGPAEKAAREPPVPLSILEATSYRWLGPGRAAELRIRAFPLPLVSMGTAIPGCSAAKVGSPLGESLIL